MVEYDAQITLLKELKRESLEITRTKEQRRGVFILERRENARGLISADSNDLAHATFNEEMRELDLRDVRVLKRIKEVETELGPIRGKRSRAVVAANRASYVENLRRRARAVVEIAKCNQTEIQFHDAMRAADVSSSLRPMLIAPVGTWSDDQSLARFHVVELRTYFPEFSHEDFEK
jgi:hypothetical protein